MTELRIWSCMIDEVPTAALPDGSDAPMRDAVARAYRDLTGRDDDFIFSGWADQFDERHRAVVENREPDPYRSRDELLERLGIIEQYIAGLPSEGHPPPLTEYAEPIDDDRLRASSTADVWAEEFAKVCPDIDQGLMIAWFANAMCTAIDLHDRSKSEAQALVSGDSGDQT